MKYDFGFEEFLNKLFGIEKETVDSKKATEERFEYVYFTTKKLDVEKVKRFLEKVFGAYLETKNVFEVREKDFTLVVDATENTIKFNCYNDAILNFLKAYKELISDTCVIENIETIGAPNGLVDNVAFTLGNSVNATSESKKEIEEVKPKPINFYFQQDLKKFIEVVEKEVNLKKPNKINIVCDGEKIDETSEYSQHSLLEGVELKDVVKLLKEFDKKFNDCLIEYSFKRTKENHFNLKAKTIHLEDEE